ncbi:MAG: hypothetical protein Q4C34_00515 [Bacteroidales bacterium]|nr:hypothetical protein [Bacteroidales bacterium]
MKKITLLLGVALAMTFTACSEFDLPNPPGQSNPEVPVFKSEDLALAQAAETLDLSATNEAGEKVTLAEITKLVDFPEAYDLVVEVELADNEAFDEAVTMTAEVNDSLVQVEPTALNTTIYNNFTKDPADITVYARMAAYAERGDTKVRLGGEDAWYATDYKYLVIPFAPAKVIEDIYYLLERPVGGTSWNVTSALPFSKTSDASVYDNPVFQIKIDVAAPGIEWAVIPGSSFDAANLDGIMGVADPEAMTGSLTTGDEVVAGVITEVSPYTIQVNIAEMTYKVALAFDYLWVPGNATSTSNFSRVMRLSTTDYINYNGAVRLRNTWYLTGQASNTGVVYTLGQDENNKPVVDPETGVATGKLVNDKDGIKMTATNGFYYLEVNLGTLTYKSSPIETISAIGAFNGWDTATAPELSHNTQFTVWTISGVELEAGAEFKFCVNHAWTLSFGGEYDKIEQNGGNLKAPESGKFDITLDFSTIPYTCTMTKK